MAAGQEAVPGSPAPSCLDKLPGGTQYGGAFAVMTYLVKVGKNWIVAHAWSFHVLVAVAAMLVRLSVCTPVRLSGSGAPTTADAS
jgi:hypothetical protein